MTIIVIIIYLALCLLVGRWAQSLKRSGEAYMFLSIFFSPLLMAIILAFAGINKKAVAAEREAERIKRTEKENRLIEMKGKIDSLWRELLRENGFSKYVELFEKNKIDSYDVIMALNEQDLAVMGVDTIGDRKRIMQLFRECTKGVSA